MKKLIRHSCYETNSSSTHSISLAKDDMDFVMDTIYPDQDGKILVVGYEFGWGWEKFNDSMTKLAYVFQDQRSNCFDMIVEVVKEQTGALEVIFDEADGYIDHEGCGTAYKACQSKESLRQFIFNKNSWLFIGNDNGYPDPMFYDVPEIKGGRQIQQKYKFELVIEGVDKTTKYKDYPDSSELEIGIDSILDDGLFTEEGYYINEKGFHWQITRSRDYYTKNYKIAQDYSTKEIRLIKEYDPRYTEIENDVKLNDTIEKYHERFLEITKRALEVPGLIKKVKFELRCL